MTIQPRNTSTDSLTYKRNSEATNPDELKKFVNVDINNWQDIMNKATASMNQQSTARIVQVGETPRQKEKRTNSQGSIYGEKALSKMLETP